MSTSGSRPSSRRVSGARPPTPSSSSRRLSGAGPPTPSSHTRSLDTPMQNLTIAGTSAKLPKCPGPGKQGKPIKVLTNHFQVDVENFPEAIFRWDVDIKKSLPAQSQNTLTGRLKRRVLELLLKQSKYSQGVYTDYEKTLISFERLTPGFDIVQLVSVDYYEAEERGPRKGPQRVVFDVQIKLAAPPLPSQPLKDFMANNGIIVNRASEYEDALNLILLKYPGQNPKLTTAARGTKVFPLTNANRYRRELGGGLWANRGYSHRVRILNGGLYLCVNTTASVMYEEGWASTLIGKWRPPRQPRSEMDRILMLEQFLKRLRVQGKFNNERVKSVWGVAHTGDRKSEEPWKLLGPAQCMFFCETHPTTQAPVKRLVSVQWWYREAYKKDTKPDGIVFNVGNEEKPVYWPAELCFVLPGQSYKRLLPFAEQAQQMITFACNTPTQNINFIQDEGLSMLGVQGHGGTNAFGAQAASPLQVFLSMSTISARRIQPPQLQFFGRTVLSSSDAATGQWNLRNRKFKKGAIQPYTVLVFKRRGDPPKRPAEPPIGNLNEFRSNASKAISMYCGGLAAKYITVPGVEDEGELWPANDPRVWLPRLFDHCGVNGVRYCFVIPSDPKWYSAIKSVADSVGMQTTITLRKKDHTVKSSPGEIANLMLKYNLKCGGLNWGLNMSDFRILGGRPTMFLGADVLHSPPGAMQGAPSCASLVASVSPDPGQFPGIIELQHNPDDTKQAVEIILKLSSMVESRLVLWRSRNNGALPAQLIMYRDGVSDQQLQHVLDRELPQMVQACKKIYGSAGQPLPSIIWQVCQKRHIVRFYRPKADSSGAFDAKNNPLPGLIVDQGPVSKDLFDWYAISHKCLQGTSVPAHHYLLYDDTNAHADGLQALTFAMSYIFGRSVTSISIPAPAKLADRLCERAKYRLHEVYFPQQEGQRYIASNHFRGQEDVHTRIADTMYYI